MHGKAVTVDSSPARLVKGAATKLKSINGALLEQIIQGFGQMSIFFLSTTKQDSFVVQIVLDEGGKFSDSIFFKIFSNGGGFFRIGNCFEP